MADGGISLTGLTMLGAGMVLAYSGVNDPEGGPIGVVAAILRGETPKPGVQISTAPGDFAGAGAAAGGAAGAIGGSLGGGADVPQGVRSKIMSIARTYLGVPYRLGGATRTGIDCSGLVLVAYRDGAGINLPHRATLQAARGRRIPRAQVLPGDLVAWGVPGNYPHIALAVDADTVIVAPTWGKTVQYQKLWEKKVPPFGYPDIIRVLQS